MSRDNAIVMFDKNISGVAMPSLELGAAKSLRARKEERTVPYFRYSLKDSNYEVCANSLRLVYEGSRNCPAPPNSANRRKHGDRESRGFSKFRTL